jgi:hypothetical protein
MAALKRETGESFPELLTALHNGRIKGYMPGRYNKPIPGDPGERLRLPRGACCDDHEIELFLEDVDAWLDSDYQHVKFRFTQVGASDTATKEQQQRRADEAKAARGVKREILEYWDEVVQLHGPDAGAVQVERILSRKRDKSEKSPKRKTIHNRLRELRAAKLIP